MKIPRQVQSVRREVSSTALAAEQGVTPSLAGLLGMIPGVVTTGMGLATTIGCPIACARNDRSAIRALGCGC
jgi:hypothetical protein